MPKLRSIWSLMVQQQQVLDHQCQKASGLDGALSGAPGGQEPCWEASSDAFLATVCQGADCGSVPAMHTGHSERTSRRCKSLLWTSKHTSGDWQRSLRWLQKAKGSPASNLPTNAPNTKLQTQGRLHRTLVLPLVKLDVPFQECLAPVKVPPLDTGTCAA